MNSSELFWNGKRIQKASQEALGTYFKAKWGWTCVLKEPEQVTHAAPIEVPTFGVIRLNTGRKTGIIPVGLGQIGKEEDLFKWACEKAPPGDKLESKNLQAQILEQFFLAVESELKANQFAVDPKNVIYLTSKTIGSWAKVTTNSVVNLPLVISTGTGSHEIFFQIPIVDSADRERITQEFYGFSETTRILVIDDSLTSRKMSRFALNTGGYQIIDDAVDGVAAFAKLKSSSPPFELVVADWHMPNMSGLELLKKIRATPEYKHLPVILVTGEKNAAEVGNAIREGVSNYIVKPFDCETLLRGIKKCKDWYNRITATTAAKAAKKVA